MRSVNTDAATIMVSRDGVWPTKWTWRVTVPVVEDDRPNKYISRNEHLRGEAFTRKGAWRDARHALDTLEVSP